MAHKNLLLNVEKPTSRTIHYEVLDENQYYGKIVANPFEKGYATTIANSLRRTLLSGLPGYAISGISVKFYDETSSLQMLYSAFDNIYGVFEDTIEIVQNLKKVRLAIQDGSSDKKIFLEFKGKKTIKGKDLASSDIHVFNPDAHILTLNKDAHITMEITIAFGRGYVSDEEYESDEVGFIPIDRLFSPVKKVTFDVEPYRIEQNSNYEQFSLEVWTDGSITVGDALADASKILKEHYTSFINFNEDEYDRQESKYKELASTPEEENLLKSMKIAIEELELNARAYNCLQAIGIKYVGDIVLKTGSDLSKTKNLGQKSLDEIKQKINKLNLMVEMDISEAVITSFMDYRNSFNESKSEDTTSEA